MPTLLAEIGDATKIGGGVLGGALVIGLGWITKELLPYLRQRQKDDRDARQVEEDRIVKPYVEQIADLKAHVSRLDQLLTKATEKHDHEMGLLRAEHMDCVKNTAALEVKVATLQDEVKGLREWRHGQSNSENAERLARQVDQEGA